MQVRFSSAEAGRIREAEAASMRSPVQQYHGGVRVDGRVQAMCLRERRKGWGAGVPEAGSIGSALAWPSLDAGRPRRTNTATGVYRDLRAANRSGAPHQVQLPRAGVQGRDRTERKGTASLSSTCGGLADQVQPLRVGRGFIDRCVITARVPLPKAGPQCRFLTTWGITRHPVFGRPGACLG